MERTKTMEGILTRAGVANVFIEKCDFLKVDVNNAKFSKVTNK